MRENELHRTATQQQCLTLFLSRRLWATGYCGTRQTDALLAGGVCEQRVSSEKAIKRRSKSINK